ncbi:MAG: hypothetical protein WCP69_00885 [Bacteroidota bacterium]
MKNINLITVIIALLISSCNSKKTSLCEGPNLDVKKLTGEWGVVSSKGGYYDGYTFIFENGLLKIGATSSTVYNFEIVNATLYTTNSERKEDTHSYCTELTDSTLILTEVFASEKMKESKGGRQDLITLKRIGN